MSSSAIALSASDLSQFLGCHHRTGLDLAVALGEQSGPHWVDPLAQVLRQRGLDHEQRFVKLLRSRGLNTLDLSQYQGSAAAERTLEELRRGSEVIVQGALQAGRWFGRPDVMLRVERPSLLGSWSYEIIDTKLALQTRGSTLLQLALYCDLLALVQGRLPESFHVATPDAHAPVQSFRTHDYLAYFRWVRRQLERTATLAPHEILEQSYPEPVEHCEICAWRPRCAERRRRDDHLSLVADLTRLQRRELQSLGIHTLAQLARQPLPLPFEPRRGAPASYEKAREQARVQLEGRLYRKPMHELLPVTAERGLARLPTPSRGDIFLDIEGDPFAGPGGREYLFGVVVLGEGGTAQSYSLWAWSAAEERARFEALIDEIEHSWAQNPGMHIYHYAPYEPAALKRLMGRHATREALIDRLLRAERFIDLHAIVRHALRASVESYSLKDLEPFYGFMRMVSLPDARTGLRVIERAVELGVPDEADATSRAAVQGYNLDDCYSALALRDWLESLRGTWIDNGVPVPRPPPKEGAASAQLQERAERVASAIAALCADLPLEPDARSPAQQARWLLAQLLEWHRRESKAPWWEFFRLRDLSATELLDERAALAELSFVGRAGGTDRCPVHRYRFPAQESEVRAEQQVYRPGEDQAFGTVEDIDFGARTIDIKKAAAAAGMHPEALFAQRMYRTEVLEESLLRLAQDVLAEGIESGTRHRAARELLLRRPPRLSTGEFAPRPAESAVAFAVRIAGSLDHSVLPIQGPPGAGKTFSAARMICALVSRGARVGVTAVSHAVIRHLLEEVTDAAREAQVALRCVRKVAERGSTGRIEEVTENEDVLALLQGSPSVVIGGTQFLWARPELHESLDVLFVDEAGQMSLANVLAAAACARSLVLLGDPQQLEQPQQGSHPEGAGVSALEHLLQDHQTIAPSSGIFLPETWRLPPGICAFTSEAFYEGKLRSCAELQQQALSGSSLLDGAGLWVLRVAHAGNQNSCVEEVDAIERLIARLLRSGAQWSDRQARVASLTAADILIVAPYNAQVALLSERLSGSGVRIGTVDKFQGQEAPVVIYSMTTSAPEDAPRGMEFLYSLNRLNVATSRAQCACVLVASPRIFEPECHTPRQMQLANALCLYLEMARELALED